MNERFICRLPLPPKALSPNEASSRHWRFRHRATAEYRMISKGCFNRDKPRGWTASAVEVEMDYYCCRESAGYRPRDTQNAIASVKAAIDGMIDAGVVASDAAKHLSWAGVRLHSTARLLDQAPIFRSVGDGCVIISVRAIAP